MGSRSTARRRPRRLKDVPTLEVPCFQQASKMMRVERFRDPLPCLSKTFWMKKGKYPLANASIPGLAAIDHTTVGVRVRLRRVRLGVVQGFVE